MLRCVFRPYRLRIPIRSVSLSGGISDSNLRQSPGAVSISAVTGRRITNLLGFASDYFILQFGADYCDEWRANSLERRELAIVINVKFKRIQIGIACELKHVKVSVSQLCVSLALFQMTKTHNNAMR